MKYAKTILAGAIAIAAAAAMPSMAMAQASLFGERLNRYLNEHPGVGAEVRANPQLLYSERFRNQHPELKAYMQDHPEIYSKINSTIPHPGERGHREGDYDRDHQWRDADWWHQHDPDWANKNHPEWAEHHPEWAEHHPESAEHHPADWNKSQPVAEGHGGMAAPAAPATKGQMQSSGHHKGDPNRH